MPKIAASSATARLLTEREALAKKIKDTPVPMEGALGLKLARSTEPVGINPELTTAYQSLASGNYALAQKQYARLVAAEPLNIDAQLGLATAAARSGDKASATQHYRRVLALDPRNGLAIMGLVALDEGAQPATLEIELKTLLGRNPDAAPLHFALGNLYASGKRWTEAQQAYFEAFRIDALNPDYLFNLAVSLDQLRQSRLALDYYQKAERVAAAGGGGQFDRSTIARRIRELGAETGRSN
jgi:tetratricopeptide (TPR) repeat protein